MFSINTMSNISEHTQIKNSYGNNKNAQITANTWLELSHVENNIELSNQYADICQQHNQEKKWVLIINPEESSLEQLASRHGVDISKVLCVSFKGKNKTNNLLDNKSAHLDIEQIKKVLCRGNCSAVILSNASFNQSEMHELSSSAQLGETHCILVSNNRKNETPFIAQHIH